MRKFKNRDDASLDAAISEARSKRNVAIGISVATWILGSWAKDEGFRALGFFWSDAVFDFGMTVAVLSGGFALMVQFGAIREYLDEKLRREGQRRGTDAL